MTTGADNNDGATTGFRVVKPADRIIAPGQTPGMMREQAIEAGEMWAGIARTAPGMVSGWHHHGAWNSVLYVVAGSVRIDYGAGGRSSMEAEAGDYLYIPGGEIHRESNPSTEEQVLVVVRTGSGPVLTNVDAPDLGS